MSSAEAKPRIVVAFDLEDDLLADLNAAGQVQVLARNAPRDEIRAALSDAEALLISNQRRVGADLLEAAPALRVLSGFGVGYDRFDVAAATKHGIAVCNTPDVLTEAVANLTIGMILSLSRRLFDNARYVRDGGWTQLSRPPGLGIDLTGKTLGIVGFGRIGREVTRRITPFRMRTLWNDVFSALPEGAPASEYLPLDELLAESDFVSLHTDLNPTSHHLIGARELALMKPGAWLVNTSRGPVIDQPALSDALREERIAGAALDVLEQEPPDAADPLPALPNAVIFPHIGSATHETRRAMRELSVRNLIALLRGERPPACVNPEVLD